jgi:hypothetical protein
MPEGWLYSTFIPFPGTLPWNSPERFEIEILNYDFRMYYPLGVNGRGPVNIRTRHLSREELSELRDDMIDFLRALIPNPRLETVISRFSEQRKLLSPLPDGLSGDEIKYIYGRVGYQHEAVGVCDIH